MSILKVQMGCAQKMLLFAKSHLTLRPHGPYVPDWASPELSPSVESCGCGLGPSPVRLG